MDELKVGDVFYFRWENSLLSTEVVLLQETSRSWVVASPRDAELYGTSEWFLKQCKKLPKNGKGWVRTTVRDAALEKWALNTRWMLREAIYSCTPAVLLEIAKLMNHELSLRELPPEVTR